MSSISLDLTKWQNINNIKKIVETVSQALISMEYSIQN